MIRPPEGVSPFHPAWVIATWFGTGLIPKIPGTLASLSALPFAWILHLRTGAIGLALAGLIALGAGYWACGRLMSPQSSEDPSHFVIDEVAGQWLTFAILAVVAAAPDPLFYVTGFVLFRLFDIMKPWPIDWAERRFTGALGVLADDVLAAILAGVGAAFIFAYSHRLGPFSS
ncbi:MAG TPA: phosphatidylglycerophosphatase A [Alphaproteobacteria bacterium]|nr:phosphatidylglycerophosphatase A [Alphaproteobacteria bacterium]